MGTFVTSSRRRPLRGLFRTYSQSQSNNNVDLPPNDESTTTTTTPPLRKFPNNLKKQRSKRSFRLGQQQNSDSTSVTSVGTATTTNTSSSSSSTILTEPQGSSSSSSTSTSTAHFPLSSSSVPAVSSSSSTAVEGVNNNNNNNNTKKNSKKLVKRVSFNEDANTNHPSAMIHNKTMRDHIWYSPQEIEDFRYSEGRDAHRIAYHCRRSKMSTEQEETNADDGFCICKESAVAFRMQLERVLKYVVVVEQEEEEEDTTTSTLSSCYTDSFGGVSTPHVDFIGLEKYVSRVTIVSRHAERVQSVLQAQRELLSQHNSSSHRRQAPHECSLADVLTGSSSPEAQLRSASLRVSAGAVHMAVAIAEMAAGMD